MILKVKNFNSGWKLFDNLTQIEYGFINEIKNKEIYDYKILDEGPSKSLIHIHSNNKETGRVLNILTNKTVFILNDEGKTIERIK